MELWDQFSSELKITKRKALGTSRPQTCQIQHDRVIKQGLHIPHHSVVWKCIITEYSRLLWVLACTSLTSNRGLGPSAASFPSRRTGYSQIISVKIGVWIWMSALGLNKCMLFQGDTHENDTWLFKLGNQNQLGCVLSTSLCCCLLNSGSGKFLTLSWWAAQSQDRPLI